MNHHGHSLAAWLLLAAPLSGAAESAKADRLARTVILDETGVKNLRLETVAVEERGFAETIFALGRIEVLPGRRAVVSSRVAGRVIRVDALPDHEVQAGDPVVIVESRQPGDPPPEITLTAPLSGLVTDFAVAPGEPVHPDKALMAIVDLRAVYGIARVPEHLVRHLARGRAATIRVPGWPEDVWDATLEHVGATADPASGTLEAAFHVRNPGLRLRPGMRAEFSIVVTNRAGVLAVPRQALQGDAASRFLYVASDSLPFAFERVPVVTGAVNDQHVEITQGLLPGDKVVTTGAYSLAFAGKGSVSLKEALDAAHGHEHNEDGSEITGDQKPGGRTEEDGHDHGASGGGKLSGLTLFSLIGNGVLLLLLVVAALRRSPATQDKPEAPVEKPVTGQADHAE